MKLAGYILALAAYGVLLIKCGLAVTVAVALLFACNTTTEKTEP